MAIPKIDWEYWNQPSIAPAMKAVIHFPLGDVLCTDEDFISVSFKVPAFDQSHNLFGPPKPATGSITFTDYDQRFNPTYNSELEAGVKIDLFLGLNDGYGNNVVNTVEDPVQVRYNELEKWAIPFTTTEPLQQGKKYRLAFTFVLPDGSYEVVEAEDIFEELFIAPEDWPNSNRFALVSYEEVLVYDLSVQPVLEDFEPYGVFYSQDWEYDSNGHEATVNIVDSMSDALLLDNRRDSLQPSSNVNAQQFLRTLLSFYAPVDANADSDYMLTYSFYEDTQATTINELVVSLGKMLFFMPDGSQVLSTFDGFYDTGITLTDDDVESYTITQTSAVSMDSAYVEANLPASVESSELASFSKIELHDNEVLPLRSRVMSVDYIAASGMVKHPPMYESTIVDCIFRTNSAVSSVAFYENYKVYGHAIEVSAIPVYNILGSFPYEIKSNPYIQTVNQAQNIVDVLEDFISKSFRVITVKLRGCYGLWVGAKLHISSEMYAINANYVIIELDFTYNGAVHTTLTLQRVS